jgi:hypothetical protein
MVNVEYEIKGTILTIKIDLSRENGDSVSGKTVIIASSKGNVPIDTKGNVLGINVYRKK